MYKSLCIWNGALVNQLSLLMEVVSFFPPDCNLLSNHKIKQTSNYNEWLTGLNNLCDNVEESVVLVLDQKHFATEGTNLNFTIKKARFEASNWKSEFPSHIVIVAHCDATIIFVIGKETNAKRRTESIPFYILKSM